VKRPSPRWDAIAPIVTLLVIFLLQHPIAAQISASPSAMNFGSVAVGSKATLSGALINSSTGDVTVRGVSVNGTSFAFGGLAFPVTIAPGQSVTFSETFAPSTMGTVSGSFDFTLKPAMNQKGSRGVFKASVALSGTGTAAATGQLSANPSSLAFGTVVLGASSSQYQTVTNSGSASVSISQAAVSSAAFSVSGLSLPQTLASGQSLTFSVAFTPQTSGTTSGNLTLTSNATNSSLGIALSGSASSAGQLSVNPGNIDFGSVMVGQSATRTGTMTASGSSVTISSASPSTAEFALSGLALPLTLNASQSVSYNVTFTPQASGSTSANLVFASNAATSAVTEALSGTGAAAPTHSVDLSWDASSAVAGYNVYRGSQSSGPFAKVNSTLDATTTYTDTSVQAGSTYYYVATSVDGAGAESAFSAVVSASIPTP